MEMRGRGAASRGRQLLLTSVSTATLMALSAAHAAAQTWTGNTSTNWFVGSNWSTGTVPTNGSVFLETTAPNPTVIGVAGAANATAGGLYSGFNAGTSGNLTV